MNYTHTQTTEDRVCAGVMTFWVRLHFFVVLSDEAEIADNQSGSRLKEHAFVGNIKYVG